MPEFVTDLGKKANARRAGKAQSTVEFALILWPFMLLLFATCDYAQFYFYEHSLRYALSVAGRYATPGSVFGTQAIAANGFTNCPKTGIYSDGKFISRNECIRVTFSNYCAINLPLSTLKIYSWPGATSATESNPNIGPGMASDNVRLVAAYPITLVTPVAKLLFTNGVYKVQVQAIFLNEPSGNFVSYQDRYTSEP